MLKTLLYIFIGSGLGGCLRYGISILTYKQIPSPFPFSTLFVNILACFLVGFLTLYLSKYSNLKTLYTPLLILGFCGGFSTFSAFSLESITLLKQGNTLFFSIYVLLSIGLGIGAVLLGSNTFENFFYAP